MGAVLSVLSSLQGTLLLGVLLAGLYMGYRAMLPKPLAGIPYNRDAAKKIFGDVPEMMRYVMRTQRIFVSYGAIQNTMKRDVADEVMDSAG
jgi:hypothetical protein